MSAVELRPGMSTPTAILLGVLLLIGSFIGYREYEKAQVREALRVLTLTPEQRYQEALDSADPATREAMIFEESAEKLRRAYERLNK